MVCVECRCTEALHVVAAPETRARTNQPSWLQSCVAFVHGRAIVILMACLYHALSPVLGILAAYGWLGRRRQLEEKLDWTNYYFWRLARWQGVCWPASMMVDVLIAGAGPAGLAAAHALLVAR